jgi:hypothetical protein
MARRTTVSMLLAGPEGATFGVFRANVRNPDKRWTWNIHQARHVGSVTVKTGETRPTYRAMAERFATPDWPAMDYPDVMVKDSTVTHGE